MIQYSNPFFPEIEPYNSFYLKVSDLHEIYIEECGNPKGKPVVCLHGGPGAGISPSHRRYFNPQKYRIILFDQRGSGKSKPYACIEENTTQDLVEDIEKIRKHLKILKWQVLGGSWGVTLGLVYAQTYPEHVSEMILRGVFMGKQDEVDWLWKFGASEIFPEQWKQFIGYIPESERGDLLTAYHKRLNDPDEKKCLEALKYFNAWEGSIMSLYPPTEQGIHEDNLPLARMECHYSIKKLFLRENQILNDVPKIRHIPGVIVHGRYDMVCPIKNAVLLRDAWPKAELRIVPDAGHSGKEPGIVHELISATNQFA
jgi:proline iminopeptidase